MAFKAFFNKHPFYAPFDSEGGEIEEIETLPFDDVENDSIDDGEESDTEKEDGKVPLATLLKEKAKRKELEKKLREFEEEHQKRGEEEEKTKIKTRLITRGYTEEDAEEEAEEILTSRQVARAYRKDIETKKFDIELKELAASDNFFKGCELYTEEIKQKMKQVKGISTEEAYILVRGAVGRKEFQTDLEQRQALARRYATTKDIPSGSGGGQKESYKLDENDKKALAMLRKAQPDIKWDEKKYYERMKKK